MRPRNPKRKFLMIQIDEETRRQLTEVATANERTMSQQVRWMIAKAYEEMVAADVSK